MVQAGALTASIGAAPRSTVIDFVSPQVQVNAGNWTLFAGATAFLGLRIWSKVSRSHQIWWDDYLLIASWLILLSTCTVISYEFATGYVTKTWDDRMLILVSISSVLTTVGQAWSKSAFAITLLRPGLTEGWKRYVLWFILVTLNIYLVITFVLQWTNYCDEGTYWWKLPGICVDYDTISKIKVGRNMYNIIMDFVLALFPWVVTWKLRIKPLEKVGICVTMSLGIIVAVISTWRTVYMTSPTLNNYDRYYFWRQGMTMVWYQAEVAGTIIVQTLPVVRHLWRDSIATRTLVSVKLKEITMGTTRNNNGTTLVSQGDPYADAVPLKDIESGLPDWPLPAPTTTRVEGRPEKKDTSQKAVGLASPAVLQHHLRPERTSWSTYSINEHAK
ncbi:hypothetical protein BD289DRAFT_479703 [Coniella lustricola]|uniref:Rhodopsin domain-containing protein n=1 Tax=Coniella lustricola TaxID=2025994 RepID=A0A2T3AI65_9PEZI|nr:hypothetical protein BD289DRAFT_479703 [Coniella lustricola]